MPPPKHDPAKPHCSLTQSLLNPRSQPHQCVGGKTVQLATESACRCPTRHKESLECEEIPVKPSTNPDDTRLILCCLLGLPVTASWDQTRVTAMQCLRPLRHLGCELRSSRDGKRRGGRREGVAHGLEITSQGPTSIEKASSESVKLDCQFSLAPVDSGPLDIEWSLLASDNQKEDKVVILYSGDRAYEDYYPAVKGRAHFNSPDPKNGDASINLTGLKSSDTGTYQCKVKKAPGIRSRKMLLTVMVRPSKPRCTTEGPTQEGKDVVLRCTSSEGTSPLQYTWEKTSDSKILPASAVLDPVGGTMNVRNASISSSGTYRCTAKNHVGMEECILQLGITPPPNTAGIIAGAIIAVLLALIIIAIVLFCCCRARHRKKYEKEISYEIREDVPPPKSRVSTARSFTSVGSQRSSLGSMSPSNLHEYALKPQYDKIPSVEEYERPPSHTPLPPPVASKIAGRNLSRMGGIPVMIPAQNKDGSIV